MEHVALGNYVSSEFDGPMKKCLKAELVIFSGLKIDKLDDLQAMIDRGTIRWVFAAGSLAMALRKADGELSGKNVSLGVAEDPTHSDKPYFIPKDRVEQAKNMLTEGRAKGITFVLPCDSVLEDATVADVIPANGQQFDIGPKTTALFDQKVGEFLTAAKSRLGTADAPVAFHNGVFGMFEDPRFEAGTKNFIPQLKRMKEAGALVFVGGGEGGKALEKYGQPDWVTHTFTAGGTVLNALGSNPVPYLQSLLAAAKK
jgi:phosphoglycerate kinase